MLLFHGREIGAGPECPDALVLYLDEQMLKDKDARNFREVTLSYTFFRQKNLSPQEIEAARNLSKGSDETDERLTTSSTQEFDNDAPRR